MFSLKHTKPTQKTKQAKITIKCKFFEIKSMTNHFFGFILLVR